MNNPNSMQNTTKTTMEIRWIQTICRGTGSGGLGDAADGWVIIGVLAFRGSASCLGYSGSFPLRAESIFRFYGISGFQGFDALRNVAIIDIASVHFHEVLQCRLAIARGFACTSQLVFYGSVSFLISWDD